MKNKTIVDYVEAENSIYKINVDIENTKFEGFEIDEVDVYTLDITKFINEKSKGAINGNWN